LDRGGGAKEPLIQKPGSQEKVHGFLASELNQLSRGALSDFGAGGCQGCGRRLSIWLSGLASGVKPNWV
jgi:hypothetical protein